MLLINSGTPARLYSINYLWVLRRRNSLTPSSEQCWVCQLETQHWRTEVLQPATKPVSIPELEILRRYFKSSASIMLCKGCFSSQIRTLHFSVLQKQLGEGTHHKRDPGLSPKYVIQETSCCKTEGIMYALKTLLSDNCIPTKSRHTDDNPGISFACFCHFSA